jgi:hypothetical protein
MRKMVPSGIWEIFVRVRRAPTTRLRFASEYKLMLKTDLRYFPARDSDGLYGV